MIWNVVGSEDEQGELMGIGIRMWTLAGKFSIIIVFKW